VPVNGGINLSVLDGWWCEGYDKRNGWAIGAGEEYDDTEYQDQVESTALYELLEHEIAPLFHDRGSDGVPRDFVQVMKNSMKTVNAEFNTNRMVEEYAQRFYTPCLENSLKLAADGAKRATEAAQWRSHVQKHWSEVAVLNNQTADDDARPMGSTLSVKATVHLGALHTEDVLVEIYHGPLDQHDEIVDGETEIMSPEQDGATGHVVYHGLIPCRRSGQRAFTVRVTPRNASFPLNRFETGLIRWFGDEVAAPSRQPQTA
jgi:glycogen phosphorylase